ncbi:hypothetical protein L1049_019958 [Liquidambar formosana]|uniref:ENT domain-containing protein n=1 Tax=Liquidambar formosana TaxID=63359 RepID=A0AAP0S6Q1_LIQFO
MLTVLSYELLRLNLMLLLGKGGLIIELRKELRVSNDEHRKLLARVNAEDIIQFKEPDNSRLVANEVKGKTTNPFLGLRFKLSMHISYFNDNQVLSTNNIYNKINRAFIRKKSHFSHIQLKMSVAQNHVRNIKISSPCI